MDFTNLVELLEKRSLEKPGKVAYTFLEYFEDTRKEIELTLKNIYDSARSIAVGLSRKGLNKGDRVIIISTQKYDNIYSIFGALFAGAVFTLVPPPVDENKLQRFKKIFDSSGAKFILCDDAVSSLIKNNSKFGFIENSCEVVNVTKNDENPDEWVKGNICGDNLAYLQYSSGSTNFPKGVMVSHNNLIHNMESLSELMNGESLTTSVSWVPFFHNIGLVIHVFFPIFYEIKSVVLSPADFIAKPIRWFEAISDFKACVTSAPNSTYALCAKIIKDEELKTIDLSTLKLTLNGSEPINSQSLLAFSQRYRNSGFDPFSFCPGYGLAESTMFVSGCNKDATVKRISYPDLQRNLFIESNSDSDRTKEIVGVGRLCNNAKAVIVDLNTGKECEKNEIGEIWLQSGSIAQGYWNMPEETEKTFRGVLENHPGYFLRTGDLGAYVEGQLYITGRCKELIIINGHNIYPQDIAVSIKENIKSLALCTMAIFSTNVQEKERVVIGIELNIENVDIKKLTDEINDIVNKNIDVTPYDVFFIKEGGLPRTDNGKIQLFRVKEYYENGKFINVSKSVSKTQNNESDKPKNEITDETELRVRNVFNQIFKINEELDPEESFYNLGGDSLDTVHLVNALENEFNVKIVLGELVENPTIRGIAGYIKLKGSEDGENIVRDKKYLYSECELHEDIIPSAYGDFDASNPRNIFLTGSSGFLGAYLIRDLIKYTKADIYCHVRAKDNELGFNRIKNNMEKYKIWKDEYKSRIKPVLGDLSEPLMGIEENCYNELAGIIDTVYHNGALLNFIFPYNHLKKTNVGGTAECLRFACKDKPKLFNYISTFSVYDNPSHFNTVALEDDELACGEGFMLGYSESKWVSEKLVRAAEKRGLKVAIYRPGDITGDTVNGIWDMSDLVSRFINACIQMEAVPDIGVGFYMTPVDFVSETIAYLSIRNESIGKAFNVLNKNIPPIKDLHTLINHLGYDVKLTSFKEWQDMLSKATSENVLKILESLFMDDGTKETSLIRRYGDLQADFDISNTLRGLEGTGISCPGLNVDLVLKYLYNFADKGYIKHPRQVGA